MDGGIGCILDGGTDGWWGLVYINIYIVDLLTDRLYIWFISVSYAALEWRSKGLESRF